MSPHQTLEWNLGSNKQHLKTVETLKSIPILKKLSEEQITKLARLMNVRVHEPKQNIITQGDEPDGFYIIRKVTHACRHRLGGWKTWKRARTPCIETDDTLHTLITGYYRGDDQK